MPSLRAIAEAIDRGELDYSEAMHALSASYGRGSAGEPASMVAMYLTPETKGSTMDAATSLTRKDFQCIGSTIAMEVGRIESVARDHLSDAELTAVFEYARAFVLECDGSFADTDLRATLEDMEAHSIVRNASRHYDGGMPAMVRDALLDAHIGTMDAATMLADSEASNADQAYLEARTMPDHRNPTTGNLVMLPGTVLPNGAVVVASSCRNAHEWIILAMRTGFHASDSYVTWKASRPGDGSDTRHGHYFDAITLAAEDFATRP